MLIINCRNWCGCFEFCEQRPESFLSLFPAQLLSRHGEPNVPLVTSRAHRYLEFFFTGLAWSNPIIKKKADRRIGNFRTRIVALGVRRGSARRNAVGIDCGLTLAQIHPNVT